MIDFVRPGDVGRDARRSVAPANPNRFADDHRRRLLHFAGDAAIRFRPSGHRIRRAPNRRAEDRVRSDRRRPAAPSRGRRRAVHRDVVRQYSGQRPCQRKRRRRSGANSSIPSWRAGSEAMSRSPIRWSTGSPRRRPTASARLYGTNTALEDNWPVFCEEFRQWVIEDKFPAGRPRAGEGRRHFHLGCRALRADEDPHPQWRPCRDRLSRRAARHPFRP